MKKYCLLLYILLAAITAASQGVENYQSSDIKQPIYFGGDFIIYKQDTIKLGPHAFFIDGQLSEAATKKYPYVFNSVNNAVKHLSNGTENDRMSLYIAPNVYWIDNPEDTAIRIGENGQPPFGLIIKCEWLRFYGLTNDPRNVVLASNRGQTIGAKGNFTIFRFYGQGTSAENITFGNYCNIDLDYPLRPALNRKKRASAIVQAQLIICDGDKIVARNSRFVSRLNLCPFVGGKRVLFDSCHFEMTDDALCGTAVYLNSTFDFYSSKPFYRTNGTGAVFLNCAVTSYVAGEQYFTKANGQVAVVDTKFKTPAGTYLGWQDQLPAETRSYQYGVMQNEKEVLIGKRNLSNTVNLNKKPLLYAYRFSSNGGVVYNTFNLLQGDDDWDPMHIKAVVQDAEKELKTALTKIPVQLLLSPTRQIIETGKDALILSAKQLRFGNYVHTGEKLYWRVAKGYEGLVRLQPGGDGLTCKVIPVNNFNETREVLIIASTTAGLEAASLLTVKPSILPAPDFSKQPRITDNKNGELKLKYTLNTAYKDQSLISWYRCSNAEGENAVEVMVSRFNEPLLYYKLAPGDAGYYIMAKIQPKHQRSDTGKTVAIFFPRAVTATDIKSGREIMVTDFKNISTRNQPLVLPGFFTWDHLSAVETERRFPVDTTKDAWFYGEGSEGAAGIKGVLQGRNGKMRFTPLGEQFGNMELTLTASPFKSAGQGFSVAPLYMDVLLKMDNAGMNGYGLRFIRTTKYHDAVDVFFVVYENGVAKQAGDAVSTTVFRSVCTIKLGVTKNIIWAKLTTSAGAHSADGKPGLLPAVDMQANIISNNFGGLGIEFRGGSPVVFSKLAVTWQ